MVEVLNHAFVVAIFRCWGPVTDWLWPMMWINFNCCCVGGVRHQGAMRADNHQASNRAGCRFDRWSRNWDVFRSIQSGLGFPPPLVGRGARFVHGHFERSQNPRSSRWFGDAERMGKTWAVNAMGWIAGWAPAGRGGLGKQLAVANFNRDFIDLLIGPARVAIFDVSKKLLPFLEKIIKCFCFFLFGHGWCWWRGSLPCEPTLTHPLRSDGERCDQFTDCRN